MKQDTGIKIVTKNRKAYHDFVIDTTYQAGLVLMGSEIKSIRASNVNLSDSYVQEMGGELWLLSLHISPYKFASGFEPIDPTRPRKLLLHKKEIAEIASRAREKGYTIIPIMLFLQRGKAKIEIALAKGRKLYDKREAIAKKDADRQIRRALKEGE